MSRGGKRIGAGAKKTGRTRLKVQFSLPVSLLETFYEEVPYGMRSLVVARALEAWLKRYRTPTRPAKYGIYPV